MKAWLTIFCCLLALCGKADRRGQLSQQRSIASSSFDPTNITGMAWRWIMTDLTTNAAVATWPDRIQANNLTQTTAGSRPTNLTAGVRFNGAQFLVATNGALNYPNLDSYLLIIQPDADGAGNMVVVADSTGAGGNTGRILFGANETWNNNGTGPGTTTATNRPTDLIYGATLVTDLTYTNGVATGPIGTPGSYSFAYLGKRVNFGSDFNFFSGYILEFCIWTNTTLSAGQVAALHGYATNKYQFSP